ncbi:hypothetical protein ACFS2C_00265 [Prauserella oleivorans]|uniref:Lipoprotein n=1 Tax=Prauserella oleivorans TaxID=1478153 RepID=A0ABW5W3N8_9PSEU
MNHRRRPGLRGLLALGVVLVLVAGCAGGREGTALPDGDEAARYVSEKFSTALERLTNDISDNEPRHSTLRSYTRVDDKKSDNTITSIQVGSPPARLWKNHSNRDSGDYRDYYHPAGSDVEYTRLGPRYASLARTEWVSMPYQQTSSDICYWGGYLTVCRMLHTVTRSLDDRDAAKQARSLKDGSVELTAEVTLDEFLNQRVVILPDWVRAKITPAMLEGIIDTTIRLDPDGKLTEIRMKGLVKADGHEFEVDNHYRLEETPTEDDLPKVPEPRDVTALTTDAQIDDFYRRMGEITSAEN